MIVDPLPAGWRWTTVEQIRAPSGRAIVSGPFGSNIGSRFFVETGVPVIRGNNLTTDLTRFIDSGFVFVTEEKAKELKNCEAIPGDLIFTAAGTLGQVGIIPPNSSYPRYIISNKQMRARVDPALILPLFAFYWLASPEMVAYLEQRNTGSSVPLINLSVLRELPVPLPPRAEQAEIVRVLSALDDKIELNRRMNRTLEAMAAAIFRSWFVDFDPVVAKAEGRQPFGMTAETAALFPDRFENSELGPITYGWSVTYLGKEVEIVKGRSYSSSELRESDTALVTLKSVGRGGGYRPNGLKPYTGKYKPEQTLTPGDLVVACTDITQNAEVIGRPAIIPMQDQFRVLVASLDLLILRPWDPNLSIPFLYLLMMTDDYASHITGFANGTTVLHLGSNGVPSYLFAKPSQPVLIAFNRIVPTVFGKIDANERESQTLAAVRDMLLPKLLSGEIRVKQAEKLVEGKI